jgi:hypothetical protein
MVPDLWGTLYLRFYCLSTLTLQDSIPASLLIPYDMKIVQPNVVVEWLTLLLRILEVPSSNLGAETDYPKVSRGFPQAPGGCRDSTLKSGHNRFHSNPFQFIIYLSPFHCTLHSVSYRKNVEKLTTNKHVCSMRIHRTRRFRGIHPRVGGGFAYIEIAPGRL